MVLNNIVVSDKTLLSKIRKLQHENAELKDLLSKIREEKDAVIKELEGKVRYLQDLLRKADSPTSQGKRYGRMLRSDYEKIQSKFMVLLDNIKEPNTLCQTLFANGVFDDNDKEVVQKCLREETTRNATDKLLSILMNCGENAYQRFLKCLKQTGYDQVINRLEQTEEPNNQNPEEIRTLEAERDTPAQILATKQKDDIDSRLQQLTDEKSSILTELSELKVKMASIKTERQDEDADMMKEIKECQSREKHLLANQQQISKEIKKLEEEVQDLKEGDRLLTMESNIENLLYLFNEHHEITKVHSTDVTIPEIRDNRPNLSDDKDISVDGSRNNTLSSEITKIQDQDVTVRVEQECRQQTGNHYL
ncbi:hypothetical protein SNE40_020692 [Patella caerulea]|uniref:CARD domain-containing protein n=1 Tax=Patella caerulea TaxID=87958 RepID=A0AAN8J4V0_PATCE